MAIREILLGRCKKGFVFSLFAFFIVFLLFSFGSLYFYEQVYTKDSSFYEARIIYVNNEIEYFKDVYVPSTFSYSLYNVLGALVNYSNNSYVLNKNYDNLNSLVKEGLINGSFNSEQQSLLEQKTVTDLINIFRGDFIQSYRGNFSYEVLDLNVYEKDPYYVSLQVIMRYEFETFDNVSSWDFIDSFDVTIFTLALDDPEFVIQEGEGYQINPVEYNLVFANWNFENFNQTLQNVYSSTYVEPDYDYTIGTSFINRLLNNSVSSYKDVIGYWNFDKDEDLFEISDNSLNGQTGGYFGNTLLLYDFRNDSIVGKNISDKTAYNNRAKLEGDVLCTGLGVSSKNDFSCLFDGNGDYISSDLYNPNGSVSISVWFKLPTDFGSVSKLEPSTIIGSTSDSGFLLNVDSRSQYNRTNVFISYEGTQLGVSSEGLPSSNVWHNLVLVYDDINKNISGYLDSQKLGTEDIIFDFNTTGQLIIGANQGADFFEGSIDEVSIYSKVLTPKDVTNLYVGRRSKFIDYKESLFGRGIELDGINDFGIIDANYSLVGDFTFETWFKVGEFLNSTMVLSNSPLIAINGSSEKLMVYIDGVNNFNGDGDYFSFSNLVQDKWTHIVVTYNNVSKTVDIFINGELDRSYFGKEGQAILNLSYIGNYNLTSNLFFKGVLDEIRLYNRSLTSEEVKMNYYNYDSNAKGCCNYLTMINPNLMGYNVSPDYDSNISYSSRLFFDFYKYGKFHNITLVNVTNITSYDTSKNYYNMKFDYCVMNAYNIYDYNLYFDVAYEGEENTVGCPSLIKRGVY